MEDMRCRLALLGLLAVGAAGCGSTTVRHVTVTRRAPAPAGASGSTSGSTSGSASGSTSGSTSGSATTASSATTSAATTSATTAASASGSGAGLAGRSPRAILAAAARALGHAGGYAMRADLVQGGSRTTIGLTTTGPRAFDATLSTQGASFDVIAVGGRAFLKGDRAFWRIHGGSGAAARARAARLAGHWLQVPATGPTSVTGSLGTLSPATLGRCLTEDHGTLTVAGRTTIGRTPAIVVRDAGDAPGSTPSTIAVAVSGPPYPLRYQATGRTRRGGPVDVCNDGKGDGATGTISFTQFGQVPTIHPPSGVESAPGGTSPA
jgi:hypothetical protein